MNTRYVVMNGEGRVIEGIRQDGSAAMDFEPKHPLLFHSAESAYRTADALHVMSGRIETFLVAERDVPAAERVDLEPIIWAASPANRDDETRAMAKELLDMLYYIAHGGTEKQSEKTEKEK